MGGTDVCLVLGDQQGGDPLGEEFPAVEGEDAAKEGTLPAPYGRLVLGQDGQVEVEGRTALLLAT